MPPRPSWYRGHEAIGAFLSGWPLSGERRWRLAPTRANGQLAFVSHGIRADDGDAAHCVQLLTLADDGRIQDITAFLRPDERWISDLPWISLRNGGRARHAKGDTWQPQPAVPRDGSSP